MNALKNIKTIKLFNFFSDFRLFTPIAILYFAEITGSYALGMSIFSVIMLSSAVFEVPTGIFSDKVGRKKTMLLGAIASASAIILYAVGGNYITLLAGAVMNGLSRSFYSGNNDALLYDTLLQENKSGRFHDFLGHTSSMFQLALAISALTGSIIASISFSLVVWLSVLPQIICIFLSFQIIEPTIHDKKGSGNIYKHLSDAIREFIHNRKLRLISLTDIMRYGIGEASFHFNSAFVATLWPIWAIGFSKTLAFAFGSVSYRYSGRLIDRFGPHRLLMISSLYNRLANIIAFSFPTVLSPIIMNSTSLLYGVSSVSTNSLLQREYSKEKRATLDSLNSFGGSIFYALFAIIIGLIADLFGVIIALLFAQLASLPVLYIYYILYRLDENKNKI